MATAYPKRPPFFAVKFTRLMAKVCLANHLGSEAAWLLSVIAGVEDAKSYRGPVTFWNEQLLPLVGIRSVAALARVRAKAIKTGWLHYEPGGKGIPGKYWVTIPEDFDCMDDAPVDENVDEYGDLSTGSLIENDIVTGREAVEKRETTGREAVEKRKESREHSSLSLPLPIPNTNTAAQPPKQRRKPVPLWTQESAPIPANLDKPDFNAEWVRWLAFRADEKRIPVTLTAGQEQLSMLSRYSVAQAIEIIKASIRGGYQGLFEPKGKDAQPQQAQWYDPMPGGS